MNNSISLLQILKLQRQNKLEVELSKLNRLIEAFNLELTANHEAKELNLKQKEVYIQGFYKNLKQLQSFNNDNLLEMELEIAKYMAKDSELKEKIEDKTTQLKMAMNDQQQLQSKLKENIIKIEKYKFISELQNHDA